MASEDDKNPNKELGEINKNGDDGDDDVDEKTSNIAQPLEDNESVEQSPPANGDGTYGRTAKYVIGGAAIGAVACGAVVVGGLAVVGLSAVGPVAGGYFASWMSAGLVTAGSSLSVLQSAAMTGAALNAGLATGAVAGGVAGVAMANKGSKDEPEEITQKSEAADDNKDNDGEEEADVVRKTK